MNRAVVTKPLGMKNSHGSSSAIEACFRRLDRLSWKRPRQSHSGVDQSTGELLLQPPLGPADLGRNTVVCSQWLPETNRCAPSVSVAVAYGVDTRESGKTTFQDLVGRHAAGRDSRWIMAGTLRVTSGPLFCWEVLRLDRPLFWKESADIPATKPSRNVVTRSICSQIGP